MTKKKRFQITSSSTIEEWKANSQHKFVASKNHELHRALYQIFQEFYRQLKAQEPIEALLHGKSDEGNPLAWWIYGNGDVGGPTSIGSVHARAKVNKNEISLRFAVSLKQREKLKSSSLDGFEIEKGKGDFWIFHIYLKSPWNAELIWKELSTCGYFTAESPTGTSAPNGNGEDDQRRLTVRDEIRRDHSVVEDVLKKAEGKCALCKEKAKFNKADGSPFLQVHHIEDLAAHGKDSDVFSNCVALHADCHAEAHYASEARVNEIRKILKSFRAQNGE